jgi:hypothetical protein
VFCLIIEAKYALLSVVPSVGFEVLIPVTTKNTAFWHITPCSVVEVHRRFGGTYWLYNQNREKSQDVETEKADCFMAQ